MGHEIMIIFRQYLSRAHEFQVDPQSIYALAQNLSWQLAKILLPLLFFLAFVVGLTMRLQVGKLWTTEIFKFRWDRFNIFKALKQMFLSPQTLVRLLKSLLLSIIIAVIPAIILWQEFVNFLPMFYSTPEGVVVYMLKTGFHMVAYTLMPMLVIAGVDLWYTRFSYEENIKMTKQEVKDERKQAEGDPVVKSQQRKKMMEQMAKRMLQDVPKADVVVTNPTHIAVALSYNPSEAPAPVVLAKGANRLAERIKEIARENRVPIRENVPLARALYKSVEVGEMIPEDLYKAVAAVLASIWRLKPRSH